jgi:hypothetical protein
LAPLSDKLLARSKSQGAELRTAQGTGLLSSILSRMNFLEVMNRGLEMKPMILKALRK